MSTHQTDVTTRDRSASPKRSRARSRSRSRSPPPPPEITVAPEFAVPNASAGFCVPANDGGKTEWMAYETAFHEAGYRTSRDVRAFEKEDHNGIHQLNYHNGGAGLGIVFDGFGGDGTARVFHRKDERGLTAEIIIRLQQTGPPVGRETEVGHVGIDTGALIISDPGYILPQKPGRSFTQKGLNEATAEIRQEMAVALATATAVDNAQ